MAKKRQVQKEETKELLLEAARSLFEARGFRKTTVKMVADQAGVAVGTVFVHFQDKSALLAASFYQSIDGIVEEAFSTLPQDGGIVAKLLHFARCLYGWYRSDVVLRRQLLREMLLSDRDEETPFRGQTEVFIMQLVELIEGAKAAGEVAQEVDSFLGAIGFFSSYFTALFGVLNEPETPLEMHLMMLERMIRFQLRLPSEPIHTVLTNTEE